MNIAIVYYSYSGNTHKAAKVVEEILKSQNNSAKCLRIEAAGESRNFFIQALRGLTRREAKIAPIETDLSAYDLIILATPIWAGSAAVEPLPRPRRNCSTPCPRTAMPSWPTNRGCDASPPRARSPSFGSGAAGTATSRPPTSVGAKGRCDFACRAFGFLCRSGAGTIWAPPFWPQRSGSGWASTCRRSRPP